MNTDQKPNSCVRFIWNGDENKCLGRTGFSWLLISAFYLCLYAFLAFWFTACLMLFFETLDNTEPKWVGANSLTLNNPGLGLRPMPQYDSTLIRFQQGKPSTYKPYTDHLEAFTLAYENQIQIGRDLVQCPNDFKEDKDACRVDLDKMLGKTPCTKEKDFGYETGEPCILLKMNRVFRFVPEPYDTLQELLDDNGLKEKPRFLAFTPGVTVGIGCEGTNPADRENILDNGIEFYPNENTDLGYAGIPVINFPFLNQEGYRSPFLMMQFKQFNKRVVIQVVCTLYARNIDNRGKSQRHGTMRFELLKD